MARSLAQIIADAQARQFDERLRQLRGSYRFDLDGGASYRVEVEHGKLSVRQDKGPADCVIGVSEEDLVLILEGKQNLLTAYMQGRVRLQGDLALAKAFHGIVGTRPQGQREAQP